MHTPHLEDNPPVTRNFFQPMDAQRSLHIRHVVLIAGIINIPALKPELPPDVRGLLIIVIILLNNIIDKTDNCLTLAIFFI
jgi:hypothetical protein